MNGGKGRNAVKLGKDVQIGENVVFCGEVTIGDHCIIQPGAVIGSEGFEFKRGEISTKRPIGKVVIGDNVEIGANTCINSGITGNTVIGNNVHIANLCHIAHDSSIGDGTIVAAKVSVSSDVSVGRDCRIGGGATLRDHITIGDGVFVGIGSVVMKSIEGKNVVLGYPAGEYKSKKKILTVNKIGKSYMNSDKRTLDKMSFDIHEGEYLSILGPSGVGKTTVLKVIAGLTKFEEGEIGKDDDIRIDMVFQEDALFPWLTVKKNVSLGMDIKHEDKKLIDEKVTWALSVVGLSDNKDYYPYQLSGGMKKRVSIARCLVLNSNLILMDEPFGALDAITKRKIQDDVRNLQKKEGFSVCMVTHDVEEAIALSDRILIVGDTPARIQHEIPVSLHDRDNRSSNEFLMMKDMIIKFVEEA